MLVSVYLCIVDYYLLIALFAAVQYNVLVG